MARPPNLDRRRELLDRVVAYLAEHGVGQVALRPLAASLGISVNGLIHHFGSKEELVATALTRAAEQQAAIRDGWLEHQPGLSQAELLRRWWRWINASSANLAIVRLGIEAAAMDATRSGLPGAVRADQVSLWRSSIERQLVAEGWAPEVAAIEASLVKAMFTGLVVDLLATGDRRRLTRALEAGVARIESGPTAIAPLPGKVQL